MDGIIISELLAQVGFIGTLSLLVIIGINRYLAVMKNISENQKENTSKLHEIAENLRLERNDLQLQITAARADHRRFRIKTTRAIRQLSQQLEQKEKLIQQLETKIRQLQRILRAVIEERKKDKQSIAALQNKIKERQQQIRTLQKEKEILQTRIHILEQKGKKHE